MWRYYSEWSNRPSGRHVVATLKALWAHPAVQQVWYGGDSFGCPISREEVDALAVRWETVDLPYWRANYPAWIFGDEANETEESLETPPLSKLSPQQKAAKLALLAELKEKYPDPKQRGMELMRRWNEPAPGPAR